MSVCIKYIINLESVFFYAFSYIQNRLYFLNPIIQIHFDPKAVYMVDWHSGNELLEAHADAFDKLVQSLSVHDADRKKASYHARYWPHLRLFSLSSLAVSALPSL